jgi:hypothetical protein
MKEEDNNNKRNNNSNFDKQHQYYQAYANVESLKSSDYMSLPRAKIINTNAYSATDYCDVNANNLRTQTIGRYGYPHQSLLSPQKLPHQISLTNTQGVLSNHQYQHISQHKQKQDENQTIKYKPQNPFSISHQQQLNKSNGFSSNTLPITKKEHQQQPKNIPVANNVHHLNYVTLKNALNAKQMQHLNQIEGWALLCQSVQALQDLFLSGKYLHNIYFEYLKFTCLVCRWIKCFG